MSPILTRQIGIHIGVFVRKGRTYLSPVFIYSPKVKLVLIQRYR